MKRPLLTLTLAEVCSTAGFATTDCALGLSPVTAMSLESVIADHEIAQRPVPAAPAPMRGAAPIVAGAVPSSGEPRCDTGPNGLIKAFGTLARGARAKSAREQARGETLDGGANLPTSPPAGAQAPAAPVANRQSQ